MMSCWWKQAAAAVIPILLTGAAYATDGPADNDPQRVRRVPPPGVALSPGQKAHLQIRLQELELALARIHEKPRWTDVELLRRAVWSALQYDEFFSEGDVEIADQLLDLALERIQHIETGQPAWDQTAGLTALGFRSRLDDTVQPYGLVIPSSYNTQTTRPWRLDVWLHGRGENVSELRFIQDRLRNPGSFTPRDTLVLHPYGRYSNAFKFAGEVDVWEAIADVQRRYRIDEDRISIRGFSMGGAGCWQFAVHYADRWFAANPGAGFAETPEFLRIFQKETLEPLPHERQLWRWYDCPGYALNLFHVPTIAYSGELDIQKQAADRMALAMSQERLSLLHLIGPGTGHQIHPDSKDEIERRMEALALRGRQTTPHELHFQTWTLKYNRMHWLTIDALQEHWIRTRVDAESPNQQLLRLTTNNVAALSIDMQPGQCWLNPLREPILEIDGTTIRQLPIKSDRSLNLRLVRGETSWQIAAPGEEGLRKRHNLQGPIDDAFMDSFLIVRPTGTCRHALAEQWVHSELEHAITHWRRQFRGEARVKTDVDVSERDMAAHHLILFGDPASNSVLARVMEGLPLQWTESTVEIKGHSADAATHAPVMIYPNPLHPDRYVVLNSGFTFREYDYLNNARQTPKLPDWAVLDLKFPASSKYAGNVVSAGFFDEQWK